MAEAQPFHVGETGWTVAISVAEVACPKICLIVAFVMHGKSSSIKGEGSGRCRPPQNRTGTVSVAGVFLRQHVIAAAMKNRPVDGRAVNAFRF